MISGKRLRAVIFGSAIVVALILTLLVEKNRVSAAVIFTVTNTNDAGTGSLREAITGANSVGDGLIDATGVSGTIDLLTALPALDGNITLNGPGAASLTVERSFAAGTPGFSIFTINFSRTVTINGLTIKNGSVIGNGGGIFNQGTLTVNNSSVTNNSATGVPSFGGGIFNTGTLTVSNSIVSNNSTDLIGGGGGIVNDIGGTLVVINSTIANNFAEGGGGIFTLGGSATISNSTIANNSAAGGGGAGILTQSGTLTMSNSTVVNNFDTGGGAGGIFNEGTATVSNSTIADNSVVMGIGGGIVNSGTLSISDSTVANNSSDSIGGGGGIANFGVLTVNNSTFSNNSATNGSGGGIAQRFGSVKLQSTIVAKNSGTDPDVSGTFTSLGHNLIGNTAGNSGYDTSLGDLVNIDPLFQLDGFGKPLLVNNGGRTPTIALLLGSPAIDHGRNIAPFLLTDQRGLGFARTYDDPAVSNGDGDGTDIGAFELQPPCNPMAFDVCLQDDSMSTASLMISTLTGDYRFTCGEQIVVGIGLVIVRGSIVTLQDYSGNRKVLAKVDKSVKRATASLQVAGATCTITDRDITNDSCHCLAP